jgi:transcriptional regulator with XRE-family HTH domain
MLFTVAGMSSRSSPEDAARRLAGHVGFTIADARQSRRWPLRELARRSGVSASMIHAIEHGSPASLETYAAIATALDLEPRLELVDPRRRATTARAEDPVHSAMGEVLAAQFADHGFPVAIDEPYQHYQFAGRADLLAWDLEKRALLHVENRTRFPNIQEAIGSYNAKRWYLPAVLAERLRLRGGFASVTNVMVCLWSSEVLHAIRVRAETFRAVCPDNRDDFDRWWAGDVVASTRSTSTLIVLDPNVGPSGKRRATAGLDRALEASTRPRYRSYAEAVEALRRGGRA